MRTRAFLLTVAAAIAVVLACSSEADGPPETGVQLRRLFADPPPSYRTVPFWVWNDEVTREKIDRQLAGFHKAGFGGVFIHPRYGLITEYLSDEWFDLARYAVERAKSLGLYVWLYDENSYPSGFAGGHVPAEMPESIEKGQGLMMSESRYPAADPDQEVVLVLQDLGDRFRAVHPDSIAVDAKGKYLLFEKVYYEKRKWYAGFSYVDLLLEGVTEKFIELTMTGYERAFKPEFGGVVPGIFTDEPNIAPPRGQGCVRWTPALFSRFLDRWGYDLRVHLPSLFRETGDWRRVRHNYYGLLLELFIERWSLPWYSYCERMGLNWTGHYWEHGWPRPFHGGDNMAMYAWHQVPGIDMLFNTFSRGVNAQFGNVRAVKELSSVANQLGRRRALSETYGGAGWELRFEDMKRLGDWQYALGVNLMNQHLSYMTLKGDRKHDFPQSFSYHAPWWPCYRAQADYFARLSLALSSGRQINSIVVLEPTTSAWMYYAPGESHDRLSEIGDGFQSFLDRLEEKQIEYDLGCENIMTHHGRIEGDQLVIGQRAYRQLVLPPGLENLDGFTAALVGDYVRGGGRVLSFGPPPARVDGEKCEILGRLAAAHPDRWVRAVSLDETDVLSALAPAGFSMKVTAGPGQMLFHQRRRLEDGQLLFLVNSSPNQRISGRSRIDGESALELDALNGIEKSYPLLKRGGTLEMEFELPPAGSLLLLISSSGGTAAAPEPVPHLHPIEPAGPMTVERLADNALILDYCDLELNGERVPGLYFYTASERIFKAHGFDSNPWVSSSQYRTAILDRDSFPPDSGFDTEFSFELAAGVSTDNLRAVVERPELYDVKINNQPVRALSGEWWLDRDFGVYQIGDHVRQGANLIRLSVHPMSIHAELAPVYVIGDFHLKAVDHGWRLVPQTDLAPGSWRGQGLPFHSNAVRYSRDYPLDAQSRCLVRLDRWNGSAAKILVNGEEAGVIGSPPYELDITAFTRAGINRIEVTVYGTLKNLLGPHHNVTRRGIVTPWSFKYAPEKQPRGDDYDLYEYGLFSDFSVLGNADRGR